MNLLWRNAVGSAQLIRCIWSEFNDGVLVPVSVTRRLWARSGLSSAWPGPDPGPCSHSDGKFSKTTNPHNVTQPITPTPRRSILRINILWLFVLTQVYRPVWFKQICFICPKVDRSRKWSYLPLYCLEEKMRPQCGVRCGCQFSLFFSTTHYFCVTKMSTAWSLSFSSSIVLSLSLSISLGE